MNISARLDPAGSLSTFRSMTRSLDRGSYGEPRCCPTSLCDEMIPPVYGRFGSYFNPGLKKTHFTHHHIKLDHDVEIRSKIKTKAQKLLLLRYPEAPKPYLGPHNIMWDPHVRRGSAVVHFSELEKTCPVPMRKYRRVRNSGTESRKNPMYRVKGTVIYPEVVISTKQEITDFSQFLEEQHDDEESEFAKIGQVQTDDSVRLTNEEREEMRSIITFGNTRNLGPEQRSHINHNFHTGLNAHTQADYFHISTEMRNPVNPIQQTIRRVSSVASKQILCQSVLESAETSELAQIRAQADAIEFWIAQEEMKKAKEKRDLCKKIARMQREEEMEAELESAFDDLKNRVAAGMMAVEISKSVIQSGFSALERDGALGAEKEAEEIGAWVHDVVTNIVVKNVDIARNMLDELIDEANRISANELYNLLLMGGTEGYEPPEVSEETGFALSKGNFGEEQGEGMLLGGETTPEYEMSMYDGDHVNSPGSVNADDNESVLTSEDKEESVLTTDESLVVLVPHESEEDDLGEDEPSVVDLLSPQF